MHDPHHPLPAAARAISLPAPNGPPRRSLRELIVVAAEQAAAELARHERGDPAEIEEKLRRIADLTVGTSAGGTEPDTDHDRAGTLPVVPPHYLDALGDALLREATGGRFRVDGEELARIVEALEGADTRPAHTGHQDFARRLTGPDAVHALVEIAHDMRSPLSSILFLVETLRRGQSGPVTSVQERQLGLIYGAALGLNTMVADVIDAVRGGQRLVDGRPIPFSIAEVMLRVCDTVRPISEEKSVPIRYVLPVNDGRIGYPAAVNRVLLNLMTNALKYTEEGSVTIGCTELAETRVSFWIEDTGAGIPAHVMGMLFDGFRPSASGLRFSNAGLGLAICQHFLQAMGSTLQVESAVHTGTRFSFELELPRA